MSIKKPTLTEREKVLFFAATHFNPGVEYDSLNIEHKKSIQRILSSSKTPKIRRKGK